ncbi:hypothetical protein [Nonomuraea pusilla]|nr:hypothetical protein [Nonomuraea pusilla]
MAIHRYLPVAGSCLPGSIMPTPSPNDRTDDNRRRRRSRHSAGFVFG